MVKLTHDFELTCPIGGFPTSSGLVVVTCAGEVFRGFVDFDRGSVAFRAWKDAPEGLQRAVAASGLETPTGIQAVLLDSNGHLVRTSSASWERSELALAPALYRGHRIFPIGDRDYLAVSSGDNRALHWRFDEEVLEPSSSSAGLMAVGRSSSNELVLGDAESKFFRLENGRWELLQASALQLWVLDIEPFGDGFLFGSPFGNVGRYSKELGLCATTRPLAHNVDELVPLADDEMLVLSGETEMLEWTVVSMLR